MIKSIATTVLISLVLVLPTQAGPVLTSSNCPFESNELCSFSSSKRPPPVTGQPEKYSAITDSKWRLASLERDSLSPDQALLPEEDIFFDSFEDCEEFINAYPDEDGDLFGAEVDPTLFCRQVPQDFVLVTGDCDDSTDLVFPGNPEVCDDLDNDCSGATDEGLPSDTKEVNNSCGSFSRLTTVGSDQNIIENALTIYPVGDEDYFLIPASETDSTCQNCDGFFTDEDFQLRISLSVPTGAGSFMFCTGDPCDAVNENCVEILAGQQDTWTWTFDGACSTQDDYSVFVRIFGDNAPASECRPYTLSYQFTPGCF